MTLCLPSNRLFDNKPAPSLLPPLCRRRERWRHSIGVATGSEECDATHTDLCENERAGPGEWEPLIFIHDREKVLVCWHRLLHLHSVIDCLPQRGSFVYLQIDEPVLLTLFPRHPLMLPPKKTLQSSTQNHPLCENACSLHSGTVSQLSTAVTNKETRVGKA